MQNLDITLQMLSYAGKVSNDPADATKVFNLAQDTDILSFSRDILVISNGTADQSVAGAGQYVVILADQELTIKMNGSADAVTLTPSFAGTRDFLYFAKGAYTGLTVSNASGTDANFEIITATK